MFEGEGGGWMLLVLLVLDLNGPKYLYIFSTTKDKDSSPVANLKSPTVLSFFFPLEKPMETYRVHIIGNVIQKLKK